MGGTGAQMSGMDMPSVILWIDEREWSQGNRSGSLPILYLLQARGAEAGVQW